MYGIIQDGQLILSDVQLPGYKPVVYAPIPDFDQTTQYVIQGAPVDNGTEIDVGVSVCTLDDPPDPNGGM